LAELDLDSSAASLQDMRCQFWVSFCYFDKNLSVNKA